VKARSYALQASLLGHELESLEGQREILQRDLCSIAPDCSLPASHDWEFDPISTQLVDDAGPQIRQFMKAVEEHADLLAKLQPVDVLDLTPNVALENWKKQTKKMRQSYESLVAEITHLQVRIAQARQLPAQPKRRITVAAVHEQQIDTLWTRTARLQSETSELAAAMRGM